jgi:anti-anti-sigma factor
MDPLGQAARAAITASRDDGALVVRLTGELDMSTVPAIETQLVTAVSGAPAPITFDLSELDFMDSSGIAMMLRVVEKTGPVSVREPSRTVRQAIEATGLQDVLLVEP